MIELIIGICLIFIIPILLFCLVSYDYPKDYYDIQYKYKEAKQKRYRRKRK